MKRPKLAWLAYLLLNVLISAGVSLAILRWHDRRLQAVAPPSSRAEQPAAAAAAPTDSSTFEIVAVIGAGQAESEYVLLHYLGQTPIEMQDWTLSNDAGQVYTFPALTLFPDGMIEIHTASGADSAVALYWGLDTPVWRSGGTVSLADASGVVRAVYRIP